MLRELGMSREQVRSRATDRPGQLRTREIERAIEECEVTVVVASKAAGGDQHHEFAAGLARYDSIAKGSAGQLIVINRDLSEAELPLSERAYVWLDCTDEKRTSESVERLRVVLREAQLRLCGDREPAIARTGTLPGLVAPWSEPRQPLAALARLLVCPLALAVLIGATSGVSLSTSGGATACEIAVEDAWPEAVDICRTRYEQTRAPSDLSWLGEAWLADENYDEVLRIAELLTQALPARAHYLRSMVALHRWPRLAQRALEEAELAYQGQLMESDERWRLKAMLATASTASKVGQLERAIGDANTAHVLAERLGERRQLVRALLIRADASRRAGDSVDAFTAVNLASVFAIQPCERAWVYFGRGVLETEFGATELAARELKAAEQVSVQCASKVVSRALPLARVWLALRRAEEARAVGSPQAAPAAADARAALAQLTAADRDGPEGLLLRAHLAAESLDFEEAVWLLVRADTAPMPTDLRAEIELARAEVAELRGGLFHSLIAEFHYRHAIAIADMARGPRLAHLACLAHGRCRAHTGLFSLLARGQRWHDFFAVLVELDAGERSRAPTATSRGLTPADFESRRGQTPAATVDDVLGRYVRGLVLVIALAPRRIGGGGERAYRLHVADGGVTGEEIASAHDVWQWCEAVRLDPTDRAAAAALARVVAPAGQGRMPLHVLATGPLAGVPLAALGSHRRLDSISSLQSGSAP